MSNLNQLTMKTRRLIYLFCLIFSLGMMTQCEKWGGRGDFDTGDDDSDRPSWAGGKTDDNPHIKGNDDSGTTRGGDYGDLYVLLRDGDGVPVMTWVDVDLDGLVDDEEHFVQPVDAEGNTIDLDQYGELPEGAPVIEVDFGRLNIVRSPQSVLDQAYAEAMKVLDPANKEEYAPTIYLDFCGRLVSHYFNEDLQEWVDKTVDSPRENMAIYQAIMKGDPLDPALTYLSGLDPLMVAAACLAAGSDKTGTIDVDEAVYINGFMDCIGDNPILNEFEYDFDNNEKYYYNFSEPREGGSPFSYDRESTFENRWLKIITLNPGDNTYTETYETVLDAMEDRGLFTGRWGQMGELTPVEHFAKAADDAVQVLDFVHGDSNIEFLPDYVPPSP